MSFVYLANLSIHLDAATFNRFFRFIILIYFEILRNLVVSRCQNHLCQKNLGIVRQSCQFGVFNINDPSLDHTPIIQRR